MTAAFMQLGLVPCAIGAGNRECSRYVVTSVFDELEEQMTVHCVTCGTALHPERAKKYTYCMARECQEKNARGLTMVAVGMNKAADELMILDEQTREELASGKYRDQRRGTFGGSAPAPGASGPFVRPVRSAEPRPVSAAQPPRRAEPRLRLPGGRGPTGRRGSPGCTTSRDSGPMRSRASSG